MAGTYRSSGNNVAKNIARLAGGIHKKNTTEQRKAKTKGKLERQAIKGTSSRSSTLKSGNKPNNDMAVGKKKTTNPPTRKRVAKGNKF